MGIIREVHIAYEYEINDLAKEESWRMFQIIGELVEGFDKLSDIEHAVTIYGSARVLPGDKLYSQTEEIARRLGERGFTVITGGGPGVMNHNVAINCSPTADLPPLNIGVGSALLA